MSFMSGFETFAYPTLGAISGAGIGAGIGAGMHLASYDDDMPVQVELSSPKAKIVFDSPATKPLSSPSVSTL